MKQFTLFLLFISLLWSCGEALDEPLPIIGNHPDSENGVYHSIPDFVFVDQDSNLITPQTFADKIYVTDFFFTSCPTICPKVKQQMLRIYEQFRSDDRVLLLSHSIDTKYDTVATLKRYAEKLDIETKKWHLVTGEKDAIYGIAESYVSVALEDADAPGGFNHSGRLILVDQNRHIRSFCDGTDPEAVTKFMKDIERLLHEMDAGEA